MKRTHLLITAIVTSCIGLALIVLLKPNVSPQFIQLHGEVQSVNVRSGVTFVTFAPSDFEVLSFNELTLEEGNTTLIGRLQYFKGKLEFVVDSID